MRSTILIVSFLVLAAVPPAARAVDSRPDSIPQLLPDCEVITKSAALVRSRVGDAFFERHLRFHSLMMEDRRGVQGVAIWGARDPRVSRPEYRARPEVYYDVGWEIHFGNSRPWPVRFDMDSTGRLLSDPARLELPPCAEHPEACAFEITSAKAAEIGLEVNDVPGYETETNFHWSHEFHRYVWSVRLWPPGAYLTGGAAAMVKMAIVDANSGDVLLSGPWKDGDGWR